MSCNKDDCCQSDSVCERNEVPNDVEGIYESVDASDDVWGDSDGEDDIITKNSSSTAEIKRVHTKQGYLDGLSNAKESSLQQGFDDGYPKGGELGIMVGRILATVLSYDTELFLQCKQELIISKVLNKGYFNSNLDIEDLEAHEVLQKWLKICSDLIPDL
ncbi:hypothetical protein CANTEDRAFT_107700 [Yamadazyma tenuis ATCC 10573]|uniref:Protein YAE1 n=1 Tax=Candida tenuis (strain ATCC 10573 / BCRC 21748 / CBS 615 / JCM 9827 / NBRC 10315 / NRRL Y-1498 / VKM Y-70) TaxID=590646 RepID=G3BBI4_CANTC|nr:uncharacterized protein CANTEDRAFT_107700 [Yamadazyma tenuis ATCC 10573]EGV61547.1 hypothetical protein CANTEDRAFT_107700 [Yamadazyma tenuis ATCC 10573]